MALSRAGSASDFDEGSDEANVTDVPASSAVSDTDFEVVGRHYEEALGNPQLIDGVANTMADVMVDETNLRAFDLPELWSYSSVSSQASPGIAVHTTSIVRSSTPQSPEYEDLISDDDEEKPAPLSPFEFLPTEVSQHLIMSACKTNHPLAGSTYCHLCEL